MPGRGEKEGNKEGWLVGDFVCMRKSEREKDTRFFAGNREGGGALADSDLLAIVTKF